MRSKADPELGFYVMRPMRARSRHFFVRQDGRQAIRPSIRLIRPPERPDSIEMSHSSLAL